MIGVREVSPPGDVAGFRVKSVRLRATRCDSLRHDDLKREIRRRCVGCEPPCSLQLVAVRNTSQATLAVRLLLANVCQKTFPMQAHGPPDLRETIVGPLFGGTVVNPETGRVIHRCRR